jgi:hypothetical protein
MEQGKLLRMVLRIVFTEQPVLDRRARVKNVHALGLDDIQQTLRLLVCHGKNNLHRLVIQLEHVRGVMRTSMTDALAPADHGGTMDAELLYFMEQPFADSPVSVPFVLLGIERHKKPFMITSLNGRPPWPEARHETIQPGAMDAAPIVPGPSFILVHVRLDRWIVQCTQRVTDNDRPTHSSPGMSKRLRAGEQRVVSKHFLDLKQPVVLRNAFAPRGRS